MITAAFSKKQLPIAMNEVEQDTKSFGNIRMIAKAFQNANFEHNNYYKGGKSF